MNYDHTNYMIVTTDHGIIERRIESYDMVHGCMEPVPVLYEHEAMDRTISGEVIIYTIK